MTQPIPSVASRFKPVLDAAPDAMVITDRLGRMVVVNAEAEKLFGYRVEELLGSAVEMLIPERYRSTHPQHRNRYHADPGTRPMGAVGGLELFGPRFLKLILANLVGNAIKFTSEGVVEVRIESRGEELRVSVVDSGPGISAEDRARVFEPFERGARAAADFVPGLGLGLAVVRDLTAGIGARVELASAPGAGSTFTIVLPRRQPAGSRRVTSRWRAAGRATDDAGSAPAAGDGPGRSLRS